MRSPSHGGRVTALLSLRAGPTPRGRGLCSRVWPRVARVAPCGVRVRTRAPPWVSGVQRPVPGHPRPVTELGVPPSPRRTAACRRAAEAAAQPHRPCCVVPAPSRTRWETPRGIVCIDTKSQRLYRHEESTSSRLDLRGPRPHLSVPTIERGLTPTSPRAAEGRGRHQTDGRYRQALRPPSPAPERPPQAPI